MVRKIPSSCGLKGGSSRQAVTLLLLCSLGECPGSASLGWEGKCSLVAGPGGRREGVCAMLGQSRLVQPTHVV